MSKVGHAIGVIIVCTAIGLYIGLGVWVTIDGKNTVDEERRLLKQQTDGLKECIRLRV